MDEKHEMTMDEQREIVAEEKHEMTVDENCETTVDEKHELTASEVNAKNAAESTGRVTDDGQGAAFFTSADVRAMSREQVRRNLPKILKSMESAEF